MLFFATFHITQPYYFGVQMALISFFFTFKITRLFGLFVGRVVFTKMASNWAANLSLGAFSIILGAVLVNMVVAKINHIYSEVVRKGTLYYYKELFGLRYKLDQRYVYLSAL